jgi:hypothetical protein
MVIDELLVSGDSLRAGMQIADSVNAAKAKLIYLVFEEFEKQLAGVAEKNHCKGCPDAGWKAALVPCGGRTSSVRGILCL